MSRPPVRRPSSQDPRSLKQRVEIAFIALFFALCAIGAGILWKHIHIFIGG